MPARLPSRLEITLLPLLGIVAVEALHTRQNELALFFIPFLLCVFRLAVTGWRAAAIGRRLGPAASRSRGVRSAAALDQASVFPLLLVECTAVMATGPHGAPAGVWGVIAGLYAVYVATRLLALHLWRTAIAPLPSEVRGPQHGPRIGAGDQ